jgi:site-specific DNA-methyltransferase (adenine-specific)
VELNKIYLGNTLDVLRTFPDDTIDIVVTSPPFNKMGVRGKLVKEVIYNSSNDSRPECQYQEEQINVLDELYRVTKPNGHIFYDHKLRWIDGVMIHPMAWLSKTRWNMRQEIIWDRGIASNIQSWRFWQVEHRIYWMQKGITKGSKMESRHAKMTSIWRIRPEMRAEHPAPFPIQIPARCIYSIASNVGLNVLDIYAGSGTTMVAAKILKHNYIGIECSPEYVEQTKARISRLYSTDNNPDYINIMEELKLHVVTKSYAERKRIQGHVG